MPNKSEVKLSCCNRVVRKVYITKHLFKWDWVATFSSKEAAIHFINSLSE